MPVTARHDETLSARKARDILRAATQVFLAEGYRGASMDEIAGVAAVSKATIYKHFGSKKTLFEAIIRERVETLVSPLRVELRADESLSATLTAFSRQYVDMMLDPSSLALHRLLVSEAHHNDELGRAVYRVGGESAVRQIADFLDEQARRGRLAIDDAALAAEQFLGSLHGYQQVRALFGVEPNPPPDRRARFIAAAVGAFLRAHKAGTQV
jgi:TetR/AcrR family transcriptional repressor of mexJK operon